MRTTIERSAYSTLTGFIWNGSAMEMAGQSRAVDMFLNFPVMDMNRNAIWHNPSVVPQDGIDRMNRFWGDDSWRMPPTQNIHKAICSVHRTL